MNDPVAERVSQSLQQLRLMTAASTLETHVQAAHERGFSPLQFADHLLADELAARQERSITVRTKLAHIPVLKSLDSFEFDAQPSLDRNIINALQTLAFVDRAENVVLLGPPGVGKTHISIGLGMRALQAGHRVYFLTAQDLLDQIRIAQLDGVPGHKQRHLNTVPLLIIDELGTSSSINRRQPGCSNSSVNVTNIGQRLLRATNRSRTGGRFSPIQRSQTRYSTAFCTTATC